MAALSKLSADSVEKITELLEYVENEKITYVSLVVEISWRSLSGNLENFQPEFKDYSTLELWGAKNAIDSSSYSSGNGNSLSQDFFRRTFKAADDDTLNRKDRRLLINEVNNNITKDFKNSIVQIIPKNRRFYYNSPNVDGMMVNRKRVDRILHSEAKFKDQATCPKGSRTGFLIRENIVLTAGHGLKLGDNLIIQALHFQSNPDISGRELLKNYQTAFVYSICSGAPSDPDWALIKLSNEIPGTQVLPLKEVFNLPNKVSTAGHPLGMPMIMDDDGIVSQQLPGQHWETIPYFFADLQVCSGCSGSPVFKREKGGIKLLGMVVGSGGNADFLMIEEGKFDWNFRQMGQLMGTRVLKFTSEIVASINSAIENAGEVQSILKVPVESKNVEFRASVSKHKPLKFSSNGLKFKDNISNKNVTLTLETNRVFKYDSKAGDLCIFSSTGVELQDFYNSILRMTGYYHSETWDMYSIQGECDHFQLNNDGYLTLEGIGTADILDNLPGGDTYKGTPKRKIVWQIGSEPFAIKSVPKVGNNGPSYIITTTIGTVAIKRECTSCD